jgi:putative transposase
MWVVETKEYRCHAYSVSSCKYHFVWCPTYRHPVLDVVEDNVRELFAETADHFGHEVLALEIANDHVHLFVQCDPKHSPADLTRQFNSYSDKHLLERYPKIRESYFGVMGSGKLGTTGERRVRCQKKWLNGISRRQNIRPSVGFHPRPQWVGELALVTSLEYISRCTGQTTRGETAEDRSSTSRAGPVALASQFCEDSN